MIESYFGENLLRLRQDKGISRKILANSLACHEQTIVGYETKHKEPKFSMLIKIADFFGVSVDRLIRAKTDELLNKKTVLIVESKSASDFQNKLQSAFSRYSGQCNITYAISSNNDFMRSAILTFDNV